MLADANDVSRGDMIVGATGQPVTAQSLQAQLCWLAEAPLDSGRKYLLRHTTREVRARVAQIEYLWNVSTQARERAPESLAMNDIGEVHLELAQPVFADTFTHNCATGSFVLIDQVSNVTVAAGLGQ